MIRINKALEEPLFLQISMQIIAAIAREELVSGDTLPSVRSLASDLGINLHTVNKAYAVLRDEGYIAMRGRSGAVVVDPTQISSKHRFEEALQATEKSLHALALVHRARGATAEEFIALAKQATYRAYGKEDTR